MGEGAGAVSRARIAQVPTPLSYSPVSQADEIVSRAVESKPDALGTRGLHAAKLSELAEELSTARSAAEAAQRKRGGIGQRP